MGNFKQLKNMLARPQTKRLAKQQSRSANVSPSRDISICLSETNSEAMIDITFNEKIRKPATLCFKTIGTSSDKQRKREKESDAARALRLGREAEEKEQAAFKAKVFNEHDETSRASTKSSLNARRCSSQIKETIEANKELVTVYDKAI